MYVWEQKINMEASGRIVFKAMHIFTLHGDDLTEKFYNPSVVYLPSQVDAIVSFRLPCLVRAVCMDTLLVCDANE